MLRRWSLRVRVRAEHSGQELLAYVVREDTNLPRGEDCEQPDYQQV